MRNFSLSSQHHLDTVPRMDHAAIGRRIVAARVRAGFQKRDELARAAAIPKLGAATIGRIERGERPLYPHEAGPLADALGIPASALLEAGEELTQLDRIEQRLARIEEAILDLRPVEDYVADVLAGLRANAEQVDGRAKATPTRTAGTGPPREAS